MKRLILIFFILFNSNLFAQKFFIISMLPLLPINSNSKIENNLFFNISWNPNSFISNAFYLGILDGFTLGTALGFNYLYPNKYSSTWYFSTSFNLPFLMQLKPTRQAYYTGFNYEAGLSFSLNNNKSIYLYFAPINFFIIPYNWIANKDEPLFFDSKTYFYYSFIIGLRKPF